MTRRMAAFWLVCGLMVLCGGAGVTAALDLSLARYPGAVRSAPDEIDFDLLAENTLTRQTEAWTPDELKVVEGWYTQRLQHAPSATIYAAANGCTLVSQADVIYRFEHSRTILICAVRQGTQVVVNEKVAWLP